MRNQSINFIYFGGEPLGVPVLEELRAQQLLPYLIVSSPDKPIGRKQITTPPPVKVWAQENNIEVWQPASWRGDTTQETAREFLAPHLAKYPDTIFVVVAYNHILPQWLLDLSPRGVINVHPSLLPKLRGASPIRTAIMHDLRDQIGVSIMLLDDQMDHGPRLAQQPLNIAENDWPIPGPELDQRLAHRGGTLLADTLPRYLAGEITPTEQNHSEATYCGRLTKADSELLVDPCNLPRGAEARALFNKISACIGIGETFFMYNGTRVKVKEAQLVNDELRFLTVIPEGKGPQDFATWRQATCTGSNDQRGA